MSMLHGIEGSHKIFFGSLACDEIKDDVVNSACLWLAILYINWLKQASVDEVIEIALAYFISTSPLFFMDESFRNPSTYQTLFVDPMIFWEYTQIQQTSSHLVRKIKITQR
jgi:hypothetical protein